MLCDALLAKEAEANEILALRAECGLNNEYDKNHVTSPLQRRLKLSGLISKYVKDNLNVGNARAMQKPEEHIGKIVELLGNPYTDELSQNVRRFG